MEKFGDEVLLHSQQRHPNIVQLIGVYYPPRSQLPMLVMEYLPLSLTQCLEREEPPLQMNYSILVDVAKGLCYLHGKRPPIVHRDLTANNVLLTSSYSAKISDLGVSRLVDIFKKHQLTRVPGNPVVMPPEALEDNPVYDHKLDVFSYGCLILHVLTGQFPQPTKEFVPEPGQKPEPGKRASSTYIKVSEWDRRSSCIENIPKENELLPLAKQCLNDESTDRPEMIDSLQTVQQVLLKYPKMKSTMELIKENEELDSKNELLKAEKEKLEKQLIADHERLTAGGQTAHPKQQTEDCEHSTRDGKQLTAGGQTTHPKQQTEDCEHSTRDGKQLTAGGQTAHPKQQTEDREHSTRDGKQLTAGGQTMHPKQQTEDREHSTRDGKQLTAVGQTTHPKQQTEDREHSTRDGKQLTAGGQTTHPKQQTEDREHSTRDGKQLTAGGQTTHPKQQTEDREHSTRDGKQLTAGGQTTHPKQQTEDREHSTRDGKQLTAGGQTTHPKQQTEDREHSTRDGKQLTAVGQTMHPKQQTEDREHSTRDGKQLTAGGQTAHPKQQTEDREHSTRDGKQLTAGGQTMHPKQQTEDREHSTRDGKQLTAVGQTTHPKQQTENREHSTRDGKQLTAGGQTAHPKQQTEDREYLTRDGKQLTGDCGRQRAHHEEQAGDPRADFRTRRMSLKRTGLRNSLLLKEKESSDDTGVLQQQDNVALLKKTNDYEAKHSTVATPNEQQPVKTSKERQPRVAELTKLFEKQSQALEASSLQSQPSTDIPLYQAQKELIEPYLSQRLKKGDKWLV